MPCLEAEERFPCCDMKDDQIPGEQDWEGHLRQEGQRVQRCRTERAQLASCVELRVELRVEEQLGGAEQASGGQTAPGPGAGAVTASCQ